MTEDERGGPDSLERRIAALEATVREISAELRAQRADAAAPLHETAPRPVATQPSPPPQPVQALSGHQSPPTATNRPRAEPRLDIEALVGRYGTLVLATITALAAVGTFLGWAISQGWLGPSQRIALGLITAVLLAVAGFRLRRRERSFGASLLGLALAIMLVCAWGAGPSLGIVPTWAAFGFAALTSIALAVFAHGEGDEPLWSVGFSGAALAPFVTAEGKSDLVLLFAYGAAVLCASGYAMGARRWMVAGRLFLMAAGAYTVALALGFERDGGPLLATGFPLVVALLGVVPWTHGGARRERLRAMGALSALAALRTGIALQLPLENAVVAALTAGAGIVWLVLVDRTHAVARADDAPPSWRLLYEGDWLDAAVLPLAFVLGSLIALDAERVASGYAMGGAMAVLFVTVVRLPRGNLRDAAVVATVLCALVSAILLLHGEPVAFLATVVAIATASFVANRAWPSASWTTLGLIGFVWAFVACLIQLTDRPSYDYTPFFTDASLASAVLLAGVTIAWRTVPSDQRLDPLLRGGILAWGFVWVHQEIAFAVSPMVATLLLVTYYASTSVAAVAVGRARRVPLLRHVGLGLAVLAAGTALYGARQLDQVAARIVADLVAAVFLLAIAYWYRRPGGLESRAR